MQKCIHKTTLTSASSFSCILVIAFFLPSNEIKMNILFGVNMALLVCEATETA